MGLVGLHMLGADLCAYIIRLLLSLILHVHQSWAACRDDMEEIEREETTLDHSLYFGLVRTFYSKKREKNKIKVNINKKKKKK